MSLNHKNPKKMKTQIHCPVSGCLYSLGSERHFTEKKLLNQHFAKVHAEKKFSCAKCQKSFGTDWYRRHHEQTCGIEWKCDCGIAYPSRLSLLTHARRNQHKLPDSVINNDKGKQIKAASKAADSPVILLIQPIIQNVTCIQPAQTSVITPRYILPKTKQPLLLSLSIPPNVIAPTPAQNGISPVIPEQIQENSFNSVQPFSPDGSLISAPNQVFNNCRDNISVKNQTKLQKSIATQTTDNICDKTVKSRQSQASQCSRRKPKSLNVGIESTHTQTAESAVVKIKKRRSRRKSVAITTEANMLSDQMNFSESSIWPGLKDFLQLNDNQNARLFKNSASTQTNTLNSNKVLCDSETITEQILFKYPWENAIKVKENETCTDFYMLSDTMKVEEKETCNTGFQLLADINSDKRKVTGSGTCSDDFQMLTDIGADTMKTKENKTCNTDFQMLNDIGADAMKDKENETCNTNFQMLTDIGVDTMKTKENEASNTDYQMLADIGANSTLSLSEVLDNPLPDLNVFSDSLSHFSEVKTSVKESDRSLTSHNENGPLCEKHSLFSVFDDNGESNTNSKSAPPTLSDIHTQTMASAVLDFNLLANMETQTTNDFSFSDLEFSDTETQTPWEDFPNIDDSPLQTDQLSIEIQTDFSAFSNGLYLDSFESMNSVDMQNIISGCSSKESLGVNTETQTLDQFCFPQFTNSESQTLDVPDFVFDSMNP